MIKGEFDLTGKAVDCRGLPALGDVGKEIFRALKLACNPESSDLTYPELNDNRFIYMIGSVVWSGEKNRVSDCGFEIIQPSDALGQAAIDAAMDGATLVFSGDEVPYGNKVAYYDNGHISSVFCLGGQVMNNVIAYKLLHEKPRHLAPSIESRVLAEKIGFKELCPVCSPKEWADREAETYDELRDAHLDLVIEAMEKDKEIELLKQRIKDMHRALNDIESMADKIKASTNV